MAATYIPSRYKSSTASDIECTLSDAVAAFLDERNRRQEDTDLLSDALTDAVAARLTDSGLSIGRIEDAIGRGVIERLLESGRTAREIEQTIAKAVVDRIEQRGMSAAEISKRYPSIRLSHVNKLKRGESLGFRMLSALTEAVGLRVSIEVTP